MEQIIVGILDSALDYATLGKVVLIYLVALWAIFSFWVYVDAKRRFDNVLYAIIFFLLVFIFNFPALIFYIIIRPEALEDLHHHEFAHGGLYIPVANFTDTNGNVEFSLNIKLNGQNHQEGAVKINIEGAKVVNEPEVYTKSKSLPKISQNTEVMKPKLSDRLKSRALNVKAKTLQASQKLIKDFKSYGDKIDKSDEINQNDNKKETSNK